MAQTFDLQQEPFAMVQLTAEDNIKFNLIKRKDRPAFIELQKKANNKELGEDYDIVEMVKPYVDESQRARFDEIAGELTLYQVNELGKAFFAMNGIDYAQAMAKVQSDQEKDKFVEQAKELQNPAAK